jgi:hypothetical protein
MAHQVGWGAGWDTGEGAAYVGVQERELRDGWMLPPERDGRGVKVAMSGGRAQDLRPDGHHVRVLRIPKLYGPREIPTHLVQLGSDLVC